MAMFKAASWNVNSLRVRLPHVLEWLELNSPDVLGLQELKLTDEQFPVDQISEIGYQSVFAGQKTYNGVAILSKTRAENPVKEMPGLNDPQKRYIAATLDGIRVINLYVPNGQEVGSEKYDYKLTWLKQLAIHLDAELKIRDQLLVMGDFNIAPTDEDVHNPESWKDKILCSIPEREAFQCMLDLGFSDNFRLFEQEPKSFSWWDYRQAAFRRNMGLRIDHILSNPAMTNICQKAYIDKAPRKLERPSDHAPMVCEYQL